MILFNTVTTPPRKKIPAIKTQFLKIDHHQYLGEKGWSGGIGWASPSSTKENAWGTGDETQVGLMQGQELYPLYSLSGSTKSLLISLGKLAYVLITWLKEPKVAEH